MTPIVYVTGIGIVSPAGCGGAVNWRALVGGGRFIRRVVDPGLTGGPAACAGTVEGFDPPAGTENWDRVSQLAAAAADEALLAANVRGDRARPVDPDRLAVSVGTSKGGVLSFHAAARRLASVLDTSYNHCNPDYPSNNSYLCKEVISSDTFRTSGIRSYLLKEIHTGKALYHLLADIPPDGPARRLAARFGANAGAHATVAACATGTLAVIHGVRTIRDGRADVVLAGSSDASLHPLWFAAFRQIGLLAGEPAELGPGWACRPFDASRSGFAISEGAGMLVLESAESVRRRGVRSLARISGYAMGSDPSGLTQLRRDGTPLARIAGLACHRAGIQGSDLAGIQAHGTGTSTNDLAEINAIRLLCGHRTHEIPVVSLKGALGHLLGAAGAVELVVSVRAVAQRVLPPNATLRHPDPSLGAACLPQAALNLRPGPILKTSMGFGGHLAAVVVDEP